MSVRSMSRRLARMEARRPPGVCACGTYRVVQLKDREPVPPQEPCERCGLPCTVIAVRFITRPLPDWKKERT